MKTAKFFQEISVIDPDSNMPVESTCSNTKTVGYLALMRLTLTNVSMMVILYYQIL